MKIVYYSLSIACDPMRMEQFVQSLRSLRRYNAEVIVYLVLYGPAPESLFGEAARWAVRVQQAGDYAESLQRLHPFGHLLADTPTLHKLLSLRHLPLLDASQILYLDADTFFFGDVDLLFTGNTSAHWFTREEPRSRRCPFGYDPSCVNESLLEQIEREEGLAAISPCNTGICLLNHGLWWRLVELETAFLDLAWRLTLSIHLQDLESSPPERERILQAAGQDQLRRALPFPSSNTWILDEVAVWLMLGGIEGFMQGFFASGQVMQGNEPANLPATRRQSIVAHYFSNGMTGFFAAVPAIPDNAP